MTMWLVRRRGTGCVVGILRHGNVPPQQTKLEFFVNSPASGQRRSGEGAESSEVRLDVAYRYADIDPKRIRTLWVNKASELCGVEGFELDMCGPGK